MYRKEHKDTECCNDYKCLVFEEICTARNIKILNVVMIINAWYSRKYVPQGANDNMCHLKKSLLIRTAVVYTLEDSEWGSNCPEMLPVNQSVFYSLISKQHKLHIQFKNLSKKRSCSNRLRKLLKRRFSKSATKLTLGNSHTKNCLLPQEATV